MVFIKVTDLSISFKEPFSSVRKKVLKNVSFSLDKGQTLGIIGRSGSGKTTLIKTILGLTRPDSGQILDGNFNELNYKNLAAQVIFQNPRKSLDPSQRIGEALSEMMQKKTGQRKIDIIQIAPWLDKVNLPHDVWTKFPHELSGGQLQRVSIARALIMEPDLLICDEPTSALDVTTQKDILLLLKDLKNQQNLTIIFISHDLAVIEFMSDTVLVLKDGSAKILSPNLNDYADFI
ncbi:ABC transporter ATP-binding protein [Vagococcus vulneris]|uniref:ABC transporter domain-containing protein n=1 Tax=Vagococcus vulneris TaxID=1977869 RepID=A0A430A010_9ENTE|nr:dipeptide/oligopeptide/nickel ABC transporter ATP-binding protein [Vagococcus vulneris]RST99609.1 hypothetical protein CBF37_04605 [Vagococcus vulneris]